MRAITIMLSLLVIPVMAQEGSYDLNLLNAPLSPASVLLGVAESEIQRPTETSTLIASLRQATGNFTQLPQSFALDLTPARFSQRYRSASETLGFTDTLSYRSVKPKLGKGFWQNSVVSLAYLDNADEAINSAPQFSMGFKFSLLEGKLSKETQHALLKVQRGLAALTASRFELVEKAINEDEEILWYQKEIERITDRAKEVNDSLKINGLLEGQVRFLELEASTFRASLIHLGKAQAARAAKLSSDISMNELMKEGGLEQSVNQLQSESELSAAIKEFKVTRTGGSLNLSGGVVFDFANSDIDKGQMTKLGAWLTYSYTPEKDQWVSFQAMGRFLQGVGDRPSFNIDTLGSGDISVIDAGVRLNLEGNDSKFVFSLEGLYRDYVDEDDPTYRIVSNLQYEVGNNQQLVFSLGRDFDGTVSQDGNLVAALNFIMGFGNKQSFADQN